MYMNKRAIQATSLMAGAVAALAGALPAFAQEDVGGVVPSVPQINMPQFPRPGFVPTVPGVGQQFPGDPSDVMQGVRNKMQKKLQDKGLSGFVPAGVPGVGQQLPGDPSNMMQGIRNVMQKELQEKGLTGGDMRVPGMRVGPAEFDDEGEERPGMRVGPDEMNVGNIRMRPGGVNMPGLQVDEDGEVRMRGMRVSSTSVELPGMRVGSDGEVRMRGIRVSSTSVELPGMRVDRRMMNASGTPSVMFERLGAAPDLASSFSDGFKKGVRERVEAAKGRAQQEIDKRIEALKAMIERIDGMKQLSDEDKNALKEELSRQIDALMSVKDSVVSDVSTTTLKADIGSITKSFRTFALTVPKSTITAAAGRIDTLANDMSVIGGKVQLLIDTAANAGTDVAALRSKFTEFEGLLDKARSEAAAARSTVADLAPDNGDETIYKSNIQALKTAQDHIQAAQKDLKDARNALSSIRKGLPKTSDSSSNGDQKSE